MLLDSALQQLVPGEQAGGGHGKSDKSNHQDYAFESERITTRFRI